MHRFIGYPNFCHVAKDVYYNTFYDLQVSMVVRYVLQEGDDKVICFEVPAKITK